MHIITASNTGGKNVCIMLAAEMPVIFDRYAANTAHGDITSLNKSPVQDNISFPVFTSVSSIRFVRTVSTALTTNRVSSAFVSCNRNDCTIIYIPVASITMIPTHADGSTFGIVILQYVFFTIP